ncbi:HAD-IIIC family phosphatase [Desulfovibrio piger]|nr:HAD-IIIC family phosphatase [Desulfovibrio piger]
MITLISNITINGPFLGKTLHKLSGEKIYIPDGYNTWSQELLSPSEKTLSSKAIFLILDGRELFQEAVQQNDSYVTTFQTYITLIHQFVAKYPQVSLIVSSLDIPQHKITPLIGKRTELQAMSYWRSQLENIEVPICELAELVTDMGREKFYSPKMWYYGSIPFSMAGEKALAVECARCWKALTGQKKKCMVLDLDNTLWGGVIGEDGLGGIQLATDKEGAAYQDFQRHILELKQQGVLLAVVSKNNAEDALLPIREHPDMLLRESDFVAIKANWEPKAINIQHLAEELNLGLDSFVFIDDNPVERESVKMALPTVNIPEFPSNPVTLASFARFIAKEYFPTLRLTQEDIKKSEQYRQEHLRQEEKQKFSTLEDYLTSLNMKLFIKRVDDNDIPRVAQLTQKTNQFNLTTRRYTETDIKTFSTAPDWQLWLGELEDKFGKYGKIILCMVKISEGHAYIDTFLMSCRVMGRGVESAFLDYVEGQLAACGISCIEGEYCATPKNSLVSKFWEQYGYIKKDIASADSGKFNKVAPFTQIYQGPISILGEPYHE